MGMSHVGRLQRGGLGDSMRFADSPSRMQGHLLRMRKGGKSPWLGDIDSCHSLLPCIEPLKGSSFCPGCPFPGLSHGW